MQQKVYLSPWIQHFGYFFIGRVFQYTRSTRVPETEVDSSPPNSQQEEGNLINYMVTGARRKMTLGSFGEMQQFLALTPGWNFSQQPFQQAPVSRLFFGCPHNSRQLLCYPSQPMSFGLLTCMVFEGKDAVRQITLSTSCSKSKTDFEVR